MMPGGPEGGERPKDHPYTLFGADGKTSTAPMPDNGANTAPTAGTVAAPAPGTITVRPADTLQC